MRLFIGFSVFLLVLVGVLFSGLLSANGDRSERINGVSLVSPPRPIEKEAFDSLKIIHANWVSIIPYGFSRSREPDVYYDQPRQWWGEKSDGTCQLIHFARSYGLKIMLKPHVWVRGEGWTGDFELDSEADWRHWEDAFSAYILVNARIADSLDVDLFCIGTEYRKVVQQRPEFWKKLIAKVRDVYPGPITYAANWDNYQNVTFWNELDFIGIDAYFPINFTEGPSVSELVESWGTEYRNLKKFSKKHDKQILFTEYGYQSVAGTAGNHWEVDKTNISMSAQANAFEALYKVFWQEPWFAGGFFWKWHFTYEAGGPDDANFTPQGKPSMDIITKYYGQNVNPE